MRRKLLYFIGFAVLATAAYVILRRGFDREIFLASLAQVRPAWLAASVGGVFLTYVMRAIRWQALLKPLKNIDLSPLISATFLGFASIYAAGRAAEVVRPLWIARTRGVPVTGAFASIVIERVFDALMILVLMAIGLAATDVPGDASGTVGLIQRAAWILLFVAVATILTLAMSHRNAARIKTWIPIRAVRDVFETFRTGSEGISSTIGVARMIGYSGILWVAVALQFWFMLIGLGLDIPPLTACLILSVSALGSLAQIPALGGGFQVAFVFSTTTFAGVVDETAVAAALMAWLVTYIPTIAVGGIYMVWRGVSARDLMADGEVSAYNERAGL